MAQIGGMVTRLKRSTAGGFLMNVKKIKKNKYINEI
jgi:hypothetical protein